MRQSISVIIPVWKEAALINSSISHVMRQQYDGGLEVIVVDGDPEGGTANSIRETDVKIFTSPRGRAVQMNKGASEASGDVLLFLHADTVLPGGALEDISRAISQGNVVGGAFDLGIDSGSRVFRLIERMASLRSRITRIPYGDQAIFLRRDYFSAMGGFGEIPLMEDVELMSRIRKAGGRIHISRKRVKTSPRRWEEDGVFYCTLRNWTLVSLYFLGVSPESLARFYR